MTANSNQKGVVLLSDLDHDGMTLPAGAEIDFGDDEFEAALVASGAARWGKGPVPASVTPLQAMNAIEKAGLAAALEAVFAANPRARQMFALATEVRRSSPIVAGLAQAAEKTEAEIDDLFRLAATL